MPTAVQCAGWRPPDPGGNRGYRQVADLLEVDDVGPSKTARCTTSPVARCNSPSSGLAARTRRSWCTAGEPELYQAHAELVVATAAAQPAQLHQALEHPVGRGARQAGAAEDLGQRQPPRSVECVEEQRDAVDDGRGVAGSAVLTIPDIGHPKPPIYLAGIFLIRNICLYHDGCACCHTTRKHAAGQWRCPTASGSAQVSPWPPTGPRGGRRSCRRRARCRWHNPRRPAPRSTGPQRRARGWVRR